MLFINKTLKVIDKEMKFGAVTGVVIGESGRGRREVFLPTPNVMQVGEVIEGLRPDLTVGLSKSGRPRIDRRKEDEIYLILSSERGYTRRGDGYIKAPAGQEVELVARGNGADGDAGRIGSWDAVIIKARDGDVFRLTWGGYGYGYDATFYVVSGGKVYADDQPEVEDLYQSLGLEVPFSLQYDQNKGRLVIDTDEWKTIQYLPRPCASS